MLGALLAIVLVVALAACPMTAPTSAAVAEDGSYTSKEEVALYIYDYGHLPPNFISKTRARDAGWVAFEGNLDEVCPGMGIGGSEFHNDDGVLPEAEGRRWTECDINYHRGIRRMREVTIIQRHLDSPEEVHRLLADCLGDVGEPTRVIVDRRHTDGHALDGWFDRLCTVLARASQENDLLDLVILYQ